MPVFNQRANDNPLAYLKKLRPDDNLMIWFAGFRRQCDGGDGSWDPELAKAEKRRLDELKTAAQKGKKPSTKTSRSKDLKSNDRVHKKAKTVSDAANSAKRNLSDHMTRSPRTLAVPIRNPSSIPIQQPQFWQLNEGQLQVAQDFLQVCILEKETAPYQNLLRINGQDLTPWDIATLRQNDWLSSRCVDTFLAVKYIDFQHSHPVEDYKPCTLLTSFFGYRLLYLKDEWETLTSFTAHISAEYLDGDIIFPYCTGTHFMSCIISKPELCIYVVDGYAHASHDDLLELIKSWYTLEHLSKHRRPPDYDLDGWQFLTGPRLPQTRPLQTDTWSCGPLTAFTILHYMVHHCLPISTDTFCQGDAKQLRAYIAYTLRNAIDSTNNQQYAQNLNGDRLSEEAEGLLLEWMGYQRRDRGVQDLTSFN